MHVTHLTPKHGNAIEAALAARISLVLAGGALPCSATPTLAAGAP